MWSDVILGIERLHLLRWLFWAAISTLGGTGSYVLAITRSRGSPLIRCFASVCATLGVVELVIGAIEYQRLALRDLTGASRLERLAWLQLGLYLGVVAVGVTTWTVARLVTSRAGASAEAALPSVGAGIAIALHGVALATLELLLLSAISR